MIDRIDRQHKDKVSPATEALIRTALAICMKREQDMMHRPLTGKNFYMEVEYQGNNSLKLRWESRYPTRQNFDIAIRRVTGPINLTDFQGEDTVIELHGDGAFVDRDVEGGQIYVYHFIFQGPEITDGGPLTHSEDYFLPFIVPMSAEQRERFMQFLESVQQPPAVKAQQAAEQFEELEETMDNLEQATIAKIAKTFSGEDQQRRLARFRAFYVQLRQQFRQ